MNKITTLLLLLCSFTIAAQEAAFSHMEIRDKSGKQYFLSADGLRLSVNDGNLTATDTQNTITLPIADLSTMAFCSDPAGVEDIAADTDTPVDAYTVTGLHIGRFSNIEAARSGIAVPGLYIMKTSGSTTKMIIGK